MPAARITLSAVDLPATTRAALADGATRIMSGLLGRPAERVASLVESPAPATWTPGGRARHADQPPVALVAAGIDGATDNSAHRAAVAAFDSLLRDLLGDAVDVRYVRSDALPTAPSGCGGRESHAAPGSAARAGSVPGVAAPWQQGGAIAPVNHAYHARRARRLRTAALRLLLRRLRATRRRLAARVLTWVRARLRCNDGLVAPRRCHGNP